MEEVQEEAVVVMAIVPGVLWAESQEMMNWELSQICLAEQESDAEAATVFVGGDGDQEETARGRQSLCAAPLLL
jgi:hypothetical protein